MNTIGMTITACIAAAYALFLFIWGVAALLPAVLSPELTEIVLYRGSSTAVVAAVGCIGLLSLSSRYRTKMGLWAAYYGGLIGLAMFMIVLSDLGSLGCGNNCQGQGVSEQMANFLYIIRLFFIGAVPSIGLLLVLIFGRQKTQKPTPQ